MRRIALFSIVGAATLFAVSIGVGQYTTPRPRPSAYGTPPTEQSPASPPGGYAAPSLSRTEPGTPVGATAPYPYYSTPQPYVPGACASGACAPVVPGEVMTVKVYSVPDLVATVKTHQHAPSAFAGNQELAQAIQQAQLQAQALQASYSAASPAEPQDEVTRKLERLKKALRVAAPKRSWDDAGGDGEIEVYAEALCLIVRQTASGHEAIAELLSQLRATQDVQIELAVEMVVLEGIADEVAAEAMQLLNRELSPQEVEQFRKLGAKTAMSSVVRMTNGQSTHSGMSPALPLQFTAVALANQSLVEFRTELAIAVDESDAALYQALSQSRTVAVGKTLAFLLSPDGGTLLMVTPKVIDRKLANAAGVAPQTYPR